MTKLVLCIFNESVVCACCQGPPGMAFARSEMFPGHQPGVNWNYAQFPPHMPPGFFISSFVRF